MGLKIGEDVEVGAQRGPVVHVGRVDARPEESLAAGDALQSGEIDLSRRQKVDVFLREIVAHHGHNFHRREIGGRKAQYVAAPPSMRSTFPCGVSTPSYATEPTTTSDM